MTSIRLLTALTVVTLLLTTLANGKSAPAPALRHNSAALREVGQLVNEARQGDWQRFIEFMKRNDKVYPSQSEALQRFANFVANLERVATSQRNERGTAIHDVTQFFDLTHDEFLQRHTGTHLTHPKRTRTDKLHDLSDAEIQQYRDMANTNADDGMKTLDWRTRGYVTPVKNQHQCGSCFSFGAVQAIEGQWFKKTGHLIPFSEEEVLDCGDEQCGGGDPLHVYDTIAELGGLETEAAYPYVAGDGETGECSVKATRFVAYVNGSRALPTQDEQLLGQILAAEGPVEINIDAGPLMAYTSGILNPDQEAGHHPDNINHAVLLVGYGVENSTAFWIVKNSWGEGWGEDGYFRLARGANKLFLTDSNPSLPLIL